MGLRSSSQPSQTRPPDSIPNFALQEEGLDMLFMRERTEASRATSDGAAAVWIGVESQILWATAVVGKFYRNTVLNVFDPLRPARCNPSPFTPFRAFAP